jgi:hypothetical protein
MERSGDAPRVIARRAQLLASSLLVISVAGLTAAELQERTLRAYTIYYQQAHDKFLQRVNANDARWMSDEKTTQQLRSGTVVARPANEDGIIGIEGGLVHHWLGVAFIAGVGLDDVLSVSQSHSEYADIYGPVLASELVGRTGDGYQIRLRLKESVGVVSAVLDVWSIVQYFREGRRAHAISEANEIRQVQNAGQSNERHLPVGRDSGYLWRAGTFSSFVERDEGVYLELETLGLSRGFPRMLGWMIEPIARRLGRTSVEGSLREFREAVLKRHQTTSAQAERPVR